MQLLEKLKEYYVKLSWFQQFVLPSDLTSVYTRDNVDEHAVYAAFFKHEHRFSSETRLVSLSSEPFTQLCRILYHNGQLTRDTYQQVKNIGADTLNQPMMLDCLHAFQHQAISSMTLDRVFGIKSNHANSELNAHDFQKIREYYNSLYFFQKWFFPAELKNAIFNNSSTKSACYKIVFKYEPQISNDMFPGFRAAYRSLQTDVYRLAQYRSATIDESKPLVESLDSLIGNRIVSEEKQDSNTPKHEKKARKKLSAHDKMAKMKELVNKEVNFLQDLEEKEIKKHKSEIFKKLKENYDIASPQSSEVLISTLETKTEPELGRLSFNLNYDKRVYASPLPTFFPNIPQGLLDRLYSRKHFGTLFVNQYAAHVVQLLTQDYINRDIVGDILSQIERLENSGLDEVQINTFFSWWVSVWPRSEWAIWYGRVNEIQEHVDLIYQLTQLKLQVDMDQVTRFDQISNGISLFVLNRILEKLITSEKEMSAEDFQSLLKSPDLDSAIAYIQTKWSLPLEEVTILQNEIERKAWLFYLYNSEVFKSSSWTGSQDNSLVREIDKSSREYSFKQMSVLQKEDADEDIIYISENPKAYFVKGMQQAIFLPEDIDLTNLEEKLKDANFKNAILDITSNAGHTRKCEWRHLAKTIETYLDSTLYKTTFGRSQLVRFILDVAERTGNPSAALKFLQMFETLDCWNVAFESGMYYRKEIVVLAEMYFGDEALCQLWEQLVANRKMNGNDPEEIIKQDLNTLFEQSVEVLSQSDIEITQKTLQIRGRVHEALRVLIEKTVIEKPVLTMT